MADYVIDVDESPVTGSVVERHYIERKRRSNPFNNDAADCNYRFGPFSTEDDAREAIRAVTGVVTQVETQKHWEIVSERVTRTSV